MLTEALGLIDYFHPHMRKQAMHFAQSANLKAAVDILSKLERKRKEDYARANAPTLFDMGITPHPDAIGVELRGAGGALSGAFDIKGKRR